LEAIRRASSDVERESDGSWRIAPDHLERVAAYEAAQVSDRPVAVGLLSAQPLEKLAGADAATWLDTRLADQQAASVREAGFGAELAAAERQRRRWLVDQGLATEDTEGVRLMRGAIEQLHRRELLRVGASLSREVGRPFGEAAAGERVEGVYRRRVDLVSGRFALIERAHDFTLVPWRPVLERHVGKPVSGLMRGESISWVIGRSRSGPLIG
jgi:hypothetical protein